MNVIRSQLINALESLVDESSDILAPWDTLGGTASAVRVGTSALTAALLRVKNLEDLHLKVAVAMLLVDYLCLDWPSEDLRVVIVDVISEALHVPGRLVLELRIAEHVADLLKVVRRFQAYKAFATVAFVFFILTTPLGTTQLVCGNLRIARASSALLREVRKVPRDDKVQVSQTCPNFKASRELL